MGQVSSNKVAKRLRSAHGAGMVEFAIAIPVIAILVFAGLELQRASLISNTMQSAVKRAGRFAALGLSTDVESVHYVIEELAGLEIPDDKFQICPVASAPCTSNSRGGVKEWVYLQACYPMHLLFGMWTVDICPKTVIRNQPTFTVPETVPSGDDDDDDDDDSGGTSGGSGCFLENTPITMSDGSQRPVQLISIGNKVRSYDTASQREVVGEVVDVMEPRIAPGYWVLNDYIKVTSEHPFFVEGQWVKVRDLTLGDMFLSLTGEPVTLKSKTYIEQEATVYNFTVEDHHNYFAAGVLVHNKEIPEYFESGLF